jgi:succinate dehydrogenase / fumarate reductase flavoprotein subunit
VRVHRFETIVIGAGGAGLMAALYASKGASTAVLSKLYPTRSHTGAAQGGISAALGNMEEDNPDWHAFDTVKGSDYLADQDAVELMCAMAPEIVVELEHMGLPFDRTPEGKIAQRRFGGHTNNVTGKPVMRACHAADRTGHMILQTLYQQCIKQGVEFFDEYEVMDLLIDEGQKRVTGVLAYDIDSGELHIFHAKAVLFATGGWGRVWEVTSNATSLTGDGPAVVWRRGIPLEDMEFFQFHPTGIYKLGILLTEGMRGEGGVLLNEVGERFMERYAPHVKDLASRDVVSRAIYLEVREGRGIGGKNYVYLDIRPETINKYFEKDGLMSPDGAPRRVTKEYLLEKLGDTIGFCETYLGINPLEEPIPVQPTAHYAMGGIPTNIHGEVVADENNKVFPGLYAAGECACVSVHGANRLGTNSLLDIVVFGKLAGERMAEFARRTDWPPPPGEESRERVREQLERLRSGPSNKGGENPSAIREELRRMMMENVGVFRTEELLQGALKAIRELKERFADVRIMDPSRRFNQDLIEAWEVRNMLDIAEVTTVGAIARTESRGGHSREDYPKRDDENWLKHTLAYRKDDGSIELRYKPVAITKWQPKERTY